MKKTMFFVALATAMGFNTAQAVDWNWKGDIRYRYESKLTSKENVSNETSQDRHRLRVRFGVNPWINEELSAGLQLATGSNETTSRNQSLTDGFVAKSIYLNEAYIDYHPMMLNGDVNLILGKRDVANTLFIEKDLVWDSDLTFEGATLQYGKDDSGKQKDGLGAVIGWYQIDESSAEFDPSLIVLQGTYKGEVMGLGCDLGAGYYDFQHINKDNDPYTALNFKPAFDYSGKDFNIVELFGSLGGDITETVPWKLYGQYAFNTAKKDVKNVNIDNAKRDAYLVGVKIGKAKNPGQLEGSAEYVRIERDAVTMFTDSDRNNASATNLKGYKFSSTYQLVQNMTLGATYMNFKDIVGTTDTKHLLQLDAVVKF